VTLDREGLKLWYRGAMERRLGEMRALRADLRAGHSAAYDAARSVAQALRGSGATFGFPRLSAVASQVESAPDRSVLRRTDGLIEHVRRLSAPDGDASTEIVGAEWLDLAAGGDGAVGGGFPTLADAWRRVAESRGLPQGELARRVADRYGLRPASLSQPSRAALRLVPEALVRSSGVLPVAEDSEAITIATADPTDLELEMELARLTGRTPVFDVASPTELERAITTLLELEQGGPPVSGEARARAPRPRLARAQDATARILVVDDEPAARVLARSVLEKGGYQVQEAGDGQEALERLDPAAPVGLIVADLNMPRLDGLELIWEMRATRRWAHVPVIVVTAETDEVLETRLIEEGADDYIRKPLDPRLFLARVAATIRRAEH
jgi:CheY-like chemotaxis protein